MSFSFKKLFVCISLLTILSSCQEKISEVAETMILPLPTSIEGKRGGDFNWDASYSVIVASDSEEIRKTGSNLSQFLSTATGQMVAIQYGSYDDANGILLVIDNAIQNEEGYQLDVERNRIRIAGRTPAGVFYGVQTFLQLLPAQVYKQFDISEGFSLSNMSITDAPRFAYRGMHMDVSRNFVTKDEVKKFIDILSMFKFNRLHWHLTDGAGWRLEIKKYPLLTKKAAFRPHATWKEFWNGGRKFVDEGRENAHGGYYTHEDVREIVAYASERYITVIPEIEMPGHSEEVFVAYPELSCSGRPYIDSDFCAGNDKTFEFLEGVLSEVIELFPSEYIHIGGDEATKLAWRKCPKCQKRIKDENLKDVDELQSYFVTRIGNFLTSKERKMIGWDEILEGGLAPGATVMVWRGHEKATQTAELKHNIVMTPGSHCYFDFYQADPANEPEAIGGYLPLSKVYSFEPVVNDTVAPCVLGAQANLWAECMPDYKHVEYMAFPRALALAEVVWSGKDARDWDSFKRRLSNQLQRLEYLNVNYHKPSYELQITQTANTAAKRIEVTFEHEQYKPQIRYTLDGSIPTKESMEYTGDAISVNQMSTLTAAIFVNDQPQQPFFKRAIGYHKAVGKTVTYNKEWTGYPAGGQTALVNGITGGFSYGDQLWQGFTGDMDVTIDMGESMTLDSFHARFMQLIGPGVYMPTFVEVSISEDNLNFEQVFKIDNELSPNHDRLSFRDFSGSFSGSEARYIRVFAKNQKGFIFVDELIIN